MFDSGNLTDRGFTVARGLIGPDECRGLAALWPEPERFRSRIVMQRHGYGQGEYQYFRYPLPEPVERLRQALYPELATVANRWNEVLGIERRFPLTLKAWLGECHAGGQKRPTPLLLRYGPGDYNCLHRDLYGDLVFPMQAVIGLDEPGVDYTGGEFLRVEQRPRAQSRGTVTMLPRGHGLVFTTGDRPVRTARGWSAGRMRHGVSVVRCGARRTLGLVFHDAS